MGEGDGRGGLSGGLSASIATPIVKRYAQFMTTIREIEDAVGKLPAQDLAAFRAWFTAFDASQWDRQFEEDVAAGRLDELADEALWDLREGRCTDL